MEGAYAGQAVTGGSLANSCKARDSSPCEVAYNQLRSAQEYQQGVIATLAERLGVVTRPQVPAAAQSGPQSVPEPSQSEVHGWLLAAIERTQAHSERINDLLFRLTV